MLGDNVTHVTVTHGTMDLVALLLQACHDETYITSIPIGQLKAFSVDNGWTILFILTLADPHLLECGQG